MECSIRDDLASPFNALQFRKKIIHKIQSESVVNEAPEIHTLSSSSPLNWDLLHRFDEDGESIQIREWLTVSMEPKNGLRYESQSKEILASGMASYLRSVHFTLILKTNGNQINILFRNAVQVKRPWYALDLIFAPIAEKICFKKLNQVRDQFMPWLTQSLHESDG